ncbi:MAG: DegV family protein [Romboutsia sp.]|uniref:DegV family protein n=1 Tax=Romboutsia sp. TaxID=1965302 RepID=UPI003F3B7732
MNRHNTKIICDGIANMPKDLAEKYDIEVVPMTIMIDGKEYRETEISDEEFYVLMRESKEMPKTSQATYVDFKEVFEKYTKEGKTILYIAGSSKSSGTYQSATLASKDIEGDIHIFDSMSICFGCGMLVLEACKMNEEGFDMESIINKLNDLREKVFVSMSMNSLEYLKKGGRISNSKALVGNLLNIRPILTVKDGLIYQESQIRGNKKIIPALINRTREVCGQDFSDKTIAIACGDNIEDREKLKELVQEEFNPKELILLTINPPMCSHSGPGFIGLTCFK